MAYTYGALQGGFSTLGRILSLAQGRRRTQKARGARSLTLASLQPYYARALTSAILATYKRYHYPDQDLIIYEVGAGNGSFMLDALRYIRDTHPEICAKTQYRIIEISAALARGQRARADAAGVGDRVEVINEDVFRWQGGTDQACFVVALEVFVSYIITDSSTWKAVRHLA